MLLPFKKQDKEQSMEFELFTYAEKGMLEVQVYGVLEVEYFLEMINVVISEIESNGIKKLVYYNESADSSKIKTSELKRIVRATRRLNDVIPEGAVAAIITNKLSYGLIRMWYAFSGPDLTYDFQLFNNHRAGLTWIENHD